MSARAEQAGRVRADHRRGGLLATGVNADGHREDLLAFTAVPDDVWRKIWTASPTERLNRKIRRCNDVVGIFPSRYAISRLIGVVLAEQTDK